MTAKFFVDTNVLVYAASNAVADQPRRDLALELLDRSDLALSAQVLAEFYSVPSFSVRFLTLFSADSSARTRVAREG